MIEEPKCIIEEIFDTIEDNAKIQTYLANETKINEKYTHECLQKFQPESDCEILILTCISLRNLIDNERLEEALKLISPHILKLFYGEERIYDELIAKILKMYYFTLKTITITEMEVKVEEDHCLDLFFNILITNKITQNKNTVSALTNIILDILISNNQYEMCGPYLNTEMIGSENLSQYNFYLGMIALTFGAYKVSSEYFQTAVMLSSNSQFRNHLEKYVILCLIFQSEFYRLKNRKWTKGNIEYYELYLAVMNGDKKQFKNILTNYQEKFFEDGTYAIIRRLFQNTIREGIRKIAIVYSSIYLSEIANKLQLEEDTVKLLLVKNLKEGIIKGKIDNNIFVSGEITDSDVDLEDKIKDTTLMHETISGLMRYKKSEPLKFETIDRTSLAYEFD
ncbi:hypothetical protein EDEG_00177 [Edhazardia aedis USNM 41457]|uniref:PCI domain-containing protein n=1 Tax=Edhazardia aedis (strain USNM 41457) TaxID=1003232 RepID=J9D857_EDHAE|nr:hypothetical protein EDEG_00177 [Edhazardia aedis USNM 41457]|eukprot:EJW03689.1 hypothetical protein EDEG_00177 [Edhazardia aedis USNM 41457]